MKRGQQITFWVLSIGVISSLLIMRLQQSCINHWKILAAKNRALFILMNEWVNIKQEGKSLQSYFIKNNYRRIAIYGMGEVGTRLVKELKNSDIEILYAIDRNAQNIHSEVKMVTIDDDLVTADAIVVTLTGCFDGIFDALSKRVSCPIISIEDMLNEI